MHSLITCFRGIHLYTNDQPMTPMHFLHNKTPLNHNIHMFVYDNYSLILSVSAPLINIPFCIACDSDIDIHPHPTTPNYMWHPPRVTIVTMFIVNATKHKTPHNDTVNISDMKAVVRL